MLRRPITILLLGALMSGCGGEPVILTEPQQARCRREAEQAASAAEAARLNATCLKRTIAALKAGATPPSTGAPAVASPAPAPAAPTVDRYAYCVLHRDKVVAASAELTSTSKLWVMAPSRYAPGSLDYRLAQRNYEQAIARLEALLPPEIRQGMDLVPQAVEAFSRCDRAELS
jgi:hypothetical protein